MTNVHNHGPSEGRGLDCPETIVDGELRGEFVSPEAARVEGDAKLPRNSRPMTHQTPTPEEIELDWADLQSAMEEELDLGGNAEGLVITVREWLKRQSHAPSRPVEGFEAALDRVLETEFVAVTDWIAILGTPTPLPNEKREALAEVVDAALAAPATAGTHHSITPEEYARIIAKVHEPDLVWDDPAEFDLLDRNELTDTARKMLERLKWSGYTVARLDDLALDEFGDSAPASAEPERRLRACVEAWPDATTGEHDPRCCRFPKSCSATVYDPDRVTDEDLEPAPAEVSEDERWRLAAEVVLEKIKVNDEPALSFIENVVRLGENVAGVAPAERDAHEVDEAKLIEVIEQARDLSRKERDFTKESLSKFIAHIVAERRPEWLRGAR